MPTCNSTSRHPTSCTASADEPSLTPDDRRADTSPVNYLIRLGHIDVLRELYGRILIPHAVHDELLSPRAPLAVRSWAANPPTWLELLSPSTSHIEMQGRLDPGESEAIALAKELHADWLLIDDAAGREQAVANGIQTIGTLGILREAARGGLLDLRTEVVRLRSLGFYVSDNLIVALLASL